MQKELILQKFEETTKMVNLLDASIKKYVPYQPEKNYTPDELEYYDSLAFRFEKSIEILLSFMRTLEIYLYSKASETLRDRLLVMQKIEIIDNIDFWMNARLLRNKISHSYDEDEEKKIYDEIKISSNTIIETIKLLSKYLNCR